MRSAPQDAAQRPVPTTCPFCRSPKITTTDDKADASSYWRCEACGEMWNVDRLRGSSNRFGGAHPWR